MVMDASGLRRDGSVEEDGQGNGRGRKWEGVELRALYLFGVDIELEGALRRRPAAVYPVVRHDEM